MNTTQHRSAINRWLEEDAAVLVDIEQENPWLEPSVVDVAVEEVLEGHPELAGDCLRLIDRHRRLVALAAEPATEAGYRRAAWHAALRPVGCLPVALALQVNDPGHLHVDYNADSDPAAMMEYTSLWRPVFEWEVGDD